MLLVSVSFRFHNVMYRLAPRVFFFFVVFFSGFFFVSASEATTEGPILRALGCGPAFLAGGTPLAGPARELLQLVSIVRAAGL